MTVDQEAARHLISDGVLRRLAALAILVAAVVHIPVTREHFEHASYIGVLFVAFTTACIVLGAGLLFTANSAVALVSAIVCAEAIVAYVLTRVVALPMLTHDVGSWLEPLGVAAIISEAIVVATCIVLVSRGQLRQRQDRSAAPIPTAIKANHD